MPRTTLLCPLCQVPYAAVRQHLIKYHHIQNRLELHLLLNFASGIHSDRVDCPVCNCKGLVRLDKHLENVHHKIKRDHYADILRKAKQRAKLKALRALRKSNPQPAMVSTLDLEQLTCSSEEEEEEEEEESRRAAQKQGERHEDTPEPSTSSVSSPSYQSVRQCQQCLRLKLKIRHLMNKLHAFENPQMPPPPLPNSPQKTPRKKYAREKGQIDPIELPRFEKVMRTWFQHISGTGKRQEENAKQRVSHVRQWIIFMADSCVPEMTFGFLRDRDRLLLWVDSLKRHAVTTQLIIIGNVRAFLKFLVEAELPEVKAPRKRIQGALFTLKSMAKMSRKDLQSHRQAVRIKKSSMLVKPAHIASFLRKAQKEIPAALLTLEKRPNKDNLERFYGLLGGFTVCITGHRKGVIANMMVEEVTSAETDSSGRRIIGVKQHKTKETFGHAQIPVTKEEYMWFNRFIYYRHKFPCGDSNILFSNSNGGPFHDLLEAFQKCWKNFGLPGTPTFSLIRSSISTCIGRSLEQHKKANVRRLMCHSNATAEKFYEADLDFEEAFETRRDTAVAIAEGCNKNHSGKQKDTDTDQSESSEDEGEGDKDNEQALKRRKTRAGVQQDSEMRSKKDKKKTGKKRIEQKESRTSGSCEDMPRKKRKSKATGSDKESRGKARVAIHEEEGEDIPMNLSDSSEDDTGRIMTRQKSKQKNGRKAAESEDMDTGHSKSSEEDTDNEQALEGRTRRTRAQVQQDSKRGSKNDTKKTRKKRRVQEEIDTEDTPRKKRKSKVIRTEEESPGKVTMASDKDEGEGIPFDMDNSSEDNTGPIMTRQKKKEKYDRYAVEGEDTDTDHSKCSEEEEHVPTDKDNEQALERRGNKRTGVQQSSEMKSKKGKAKKMGKTRRQKENSSKEVSRKKRKSKLIRTDEESHGKVAVASDEGNSEDSPIILDNFSDDDIRPRMTPQRSAPKETDRESVVIIPILSFSEDDMAVTGDMTQTENPTEQTIKPAQHMETDKPARHTVTQKPSDQMETDMPAEETETEKPVEETERPVEEIEKPAEEVERPVEETEKPAEEVERPVEETEKPAEEVERPVVETKPAKETEPEKPAGETERPVEEIEKPAEEVERPVEEKEPEKPVEEKERPVEEREKPAEETERPVEREKPAKEETEKPGEQTQNDKPAEHTQTEMLSEEIETERLTEDTEKEKPAQQADAEKPKQQHPTDPTTSSPPNPPASSTPPRRNKKKSPLAKYKYLKKRGTQPKVVQALFSPRRLRQRWCEVKVKKLDQMVLDELLKQRKKPKDKGKAKIK